MLKYWNNTLENISKDQRNDKFKMIVNKVIYEVPLSYALGISPLITERYLKDPTFDEMHININESLEKEDKKIQDEFSKFIKGENISREIFFEIGNQLKNNEMIKEWRKSQKLTKEDVIRSIKAYHQNFKNQNNNEIETIKKELEYIG